MCRTSSPKSFTQLREFVNHSNDVEDAADAIMQIRNAIGHSQEEKRKKLSKISPNVSYQALQVFIWYTELSLLRILGYADKHHNRCSREIYAFKAEEFVPWVAHEHRKDNEVESITVLQLPVKDAC